MTKNLLLLLVVVVLIGVAKSANPPLPQPSETFGSNEVGIEIAEPGKSNVTGFGDWGRVFNASGAEVLYFRFHDYSYFSLYRYDLEEQFTITSSDPTLCNTTKLSGSMPSLWGWLSMATYAGSFSVFGQNLNFWTASIAGVVLNLGVTSTSPNTPVIFERKIPTQTLGFYFKNFYVGPPNSKYFDVPSLCKSSSGAPSPSSSSSEKVFSFSLF